MASTCLPAYLRAYLGAYLVGCYESIDRAKEDCGPLEQRLPSEHEEDDEVTRATECFTNQQQQTPCEQQGLSDRVLLRRFFVSHGSRNRLELSIELRERVS